MTEITAKEAYEDAVKIRMHELRSCFYPPYDNIDKLAFDDHEPGECAQCDAYRRLSREENVDRSGIREYTQ